jgi:hypothetical protein
MIEQLKGAPMLFPKYVIAVMVIASVVAIPGSSQVASGKQNSHRPVGHLTVATAQRVLNEQVNQTEIYNTLFTCHACYDADDKEDNDKAPVVSTFSEAMNQFLIEQGYIRAGAGQNVFTAKAKRSKYYSQDGPGLRLANFRNPRILTSSIIDPRHVPIEYELVPTELTAKVFGKVQQIRTTVRLSY